MGTRGGLLRKPSECRRQMKRSNMGIKRVDSEETPQESANIPFVDRLSQEIRRIVRPAGIRCTFFAPDSARGLYSVKDRLPMENSTHVVYLIKCKTCNSEYVGETMRALSVCRKEHKDAVQLSNLEKSAVAEHIYSHAEPHEVNWSKVEVLDRARNKKLRKINEAFYIEIRKPSMNRDRGIEVSETWNAIP